MANPHQDVDAHLADDDHNWYPERTTPQGTQENGVDFEHEERDANVPGIIRWFAALSGMVVVVLFVLWGAFQIMVRKEQEPPMSPVFAQEQPLPQPRLIPNPVDSPMGPGQLMRQPMEYHEDFVEEENGALEKVELFDTATGLPRLPADVDSVISELASKGGSTGAGSDGFAGERYPADYSGGLVQEDRLR